MQNDEIVRRVVEHPKYQELVQKRTRVSLAFFALMVVIYAGFILTLAYLPELFSRPIGDGYTMSVGVLSATLVAVSAVLMIAAYVRFSNKHFDPLIKAIVEDVT
jgi:uncharacterized membrane protein (DUF485 family)